MANDELKKIKELLEIVGNKVGRLETHVTAHSSAMYLMKDQQSVMNEKLDSITDGVKVLKADVDVLKGDVKEVKKDVKELREDVDGARGDIETIRMDVTWIKEKEGMGHSRNKREIDEIKTHLGMPLMSDVPEI